MKFCTSVVMTTYNGSKYVEQQLESLLQQTKKPSEVLIFDDGSTDGTQELVKKFIKENHLLKSEWHFIQNEKNLGWRANFMQGFQKAKGDFIFPCDQDDIWDSRKIEEMKTVMIKNPSINVLCCNLSPFSENNKKIKLPAFNLNNYGNKEVEKVSFGKMWMNPMRQGCCMCFRKNFLEKINKVWFPECAHDLVLWALAMTTDSLFIYNKKLIQYRRHEGNNSPSNEKNKKRRIVILQLYINLANSIIKNSYDISVANMKKMNELLKFYKDRQKLIENKSFAKLIHLIFKINLYPRPRAYLGDIVSMLR